MNTRYVLIFCCCFLFFPSLFPVFSTAADQQNPYKIFLVHSYDAENVCGQPQEAGLLEGLVEQGFVLGGNLIVEHYYMKTKRVHTTPEQIERQGRLALEKINTWRPDVVVTFDDNAAREVMLPLVDSEIPVVFSGINNTPEYYNGRKQFLNSRKNPGHNVTGVYEKLHVAKSLQVMKDVLPDLKRIVVLVDDSPTGRAMRKQVEQELSGKSGEILYSFWLARDFAEYKRMIRRINSDPAIGSYYQACSLLRDTDGVATVPEITAWSLAHSKKPAMAVNYSFTSLGLFGGASVNFPAMGRQAAAMVAAILKGGNPGNIAVEDADDYAIVFNLARARQLGISIPPELLGAADEVYETMELGSPIIHPLVFIIHSWKQDYDEIQLEKGIFTELETAGWISGTTLKTEHFYLDIERLSSQDELREHAGKVLHEIHRHRPDAIVVLGDAAATEVMLPLVGSPHPVLFGGVHAPLSFYRQKKDSVGNPLFPGKNVTGVSSLFSYAKTMETVRIMLPEARRIVIVSSAAWPWIDAIVEDFADNVQWSSAEEEFPEIEVRFEQVSTEDEFRQLTLRLEADPQVDVISAMLPVGLIRADGSTVSQEEISSWLLTHQHKPDFTLLAGWVRYGFLISAAIDPAVTGRQLGRQLMRIFSGDLPAAIPIERPVGNALFVNQARARQLGIQIPVGIFEAAQQVYNSMEPVFYRDEK